MKLGSHQKTIEVHFKRCLQKQGLTLDQAISIASQQNNYDERISAALRDFLSNPSVGQAEVTSLLGIYRKKTLGFIKRCNN